MSGVADSIDRDTMHSPLIEVIPPAIHRDRTSGAYRSFRAMARTVPKNLRHPHHSCPSPSCQQQPAWTTSGHVGTRRSRTSSLTTNTRWRVHDHRERRSFTQTRTLHRWRKDGCISAEQETPIAPWRIRVNHELPSRGRPPGSQAEVPDTRLPQGAHCKLRAFMQA